MLITNTADRVGDITSMNFPERIAFVAERLGVSADDVKSMIAHPREDKTFPADKTNIPAYVDFTVLNAFATEADIISLCDQAKQFKTVSVCVNPARVRTAAEQLKGTSIGVASVVGFPLGATPAMIKAAETAFAISQGATEIDMVINIGALIEGDYKTVLEDIRAVRECCPHHYLKVIIETCYLTREQIIDASILTLTCADCVKTSTGFGKEGAKAEHVRLMREVVGPKFGVKAAGGVRTKEAAHEMIEAGASRIGASSRALFE